MKNKGKQGSRLEQKALEQIILAGLPEPEREYKFHPVRQWRADFAWPNQMLLLEIEGGIWLSTTQEHGKGHAHPERFEADVQKYNAATLSGWRLLRATAKTIRDGQMLADLQQFFSGIEDW